MVITKQQTPIILSEGTCDTETINNAVASYIEKNFSELAGLFQEERELDEDEAYLFIEDKLNELCDFDVLFGSHIGDPCCVGFFGEA